MSVRRRLRRRARKSRPAHPRVALVALLVLASGCAALVFQIAWMRELRLVFGATTASTAAVLAIFMAGLGIGSAVLGKLADRVANPLRMYGLLEVAIALSTAVTPWLIGLATSIYLNLGGQESLGVAGATAIRLLLAAAIMAVPTVLMGGTLPAAVRSVTRTTDVHRRALGVLYGSNTLGAVLGSTIATFFALEQLGTRATLMAGCALGFLVGVMAIALSRAFPPLTAEDRPTGGESTSASAATPEPEHDDNARSTCRRASDLSHGGGAWLHVFCARAGVVPHVGSDSGRHGVYVRADLVRRTDGNRRRRHRVQLRILAMAAELGGAGRDLRPGGAADDYSVRTGRPPGTLRRIPCAKGGEALANLFSLGFT